MQMESQPDADPVLFPEVAAEQQSEPVKIGQIPIDAHHEDRYWTMAPDRSRAYEEATEFGPDGYPV
jgi:hypothetical protein